MRRQRHASHAGKAFYAAMITLAYALRQLIALRGYQQ